MSRRYRKNWPPKLRRLVDKALELGGELREGKTHFGIFLHGRRIFTMSKTPSDHRAYKNATTNLRRALHDQGQEDHSPGHA